MEIVAYLLIALLIVTFLVLGPFKIWTRKDENTGAPHGPDPEITPEMLEDYWAEKQAADDQ